MSRGCQYEEVAAATLLYCTCCGHERQGSWVAELLVCLRGTCMLGACAFRAV